MNIVHRGKIKNRKKNDITNNEYDIPNESSLTISEKFFGFQIKTLFYL